MRRWAPAVPAIAAAALVPAQRHFGSTAVCLKKKRRKHVAPPPGGGGSHAAAEHDPLLRSGQPSPVGTADLSLAGAPLVPHEEDYRALLMDLLLYRQETLRPVLRALTEERERLAAQSAELDIKVARLAAIREDIRTMLEEHRHSQEQLLAAAATEVATSTEGDQVAPPRSASETTNHTPSLPIHSMMEF